RIELLQDGQGIRFRDKNHTRIGDIAAEGAPDLREIALFTVPEGFAFDVTKPWELQLLVQRGFGARDKASIFYDLGYTLPDQYVTSTAPAKPVPAPVQPAQDAATANNPHVSAPVGEASMPDFFGEDNPLWIQMWQMNKINI